MKLALLLIGVAFSSLVCQAAEREGVVRLNERVGVAGEAIRLSALLPADAPAEVRLAAAGVELGRSPQLGSTRTLSHEQIVQSLHGQAELLARFSIPGQVTVLRQSWPIKAERIRKAILDFAEKQNLSLGASDAIALDLSGSPQALTESPALIVQSGDVDNLRHQLRFVVLCMSRQDCGPFLVSASLPAKFSVGKRVQPNSGAKQSPPKRAAILVRAGQPAMLNMQDGDIRIVLRVTCLERGSLGQTIRTRDASSHRIFRAEVVGAGTLRASL